MSVSEIPTAEELRELGDEQWDPSPVSAAQIQASAIGALLLVGSGIIAALDRLQPAGFAHKLEELAQDHASLTVANGELQRERDHLQGEIRSRDLELQELRNQVADLQAVIAKGLGNLL